MNLTITSITPQINGTTSFTNVTVIGKVYTTQNITQDLSEIQERILTLEINKVDSLKLDW